MKKILTVVLEKEKNILENMLQLYLHDISSDFSISFNNLSGKYIYDDLNKYFNTLNKAYFIKENDDIVGFIFVDLIDNMFILQEFFVLNNYKGKHYGEKAVFELFYNIKGNWVIKVLPNSRRAESFWIKTISKYTCDYNLERVGKYNRVIITFDNK